MTRERVEQILSMPHTGTGNIGMVVLTAAEREARLRDLIDVSPLPKRPDVTTVETWMLHTYLEHWKGTWEHAQIIERNRLAADPPPSLETPR